MTDPSTDEYTLLGLLADIRAAAGDRDGRLMQPELVEHIRGLKARADEAEQLRGFAQRVMEAWPEGGLDGFDLQDTAEEFGLLQRVEVAEPCGEGCSCVEYGADFPTDCYHRTSLLLPEPDARAWVNPLAAEVEALQSKLAAERAASVIEWEPGRSYTAAELLRRAIFGLRVRRNRPPWRAVSHLFGCGSGVAHHLCRWAGRDPDTGDAIDATRSDMEITP